MQEVERLCDPELRRHILPHQFAALCLEALPLLHRQRNRDRNPQVGRILVEGDCRELPRSVQGEPPQNASHHRVEVIRPNGRQAAGAP